MKSRTALVVWLGFSFSLPCPAAKPSFIVKVQNRVELLERMQEEGSFRWNDMALVKENLNRLRSFPFSGLSELPGQWDLFPSYQEKWGLFDLLESGLTYHPWDNSRILHGLSPDGLLTRRDVLYRNLKPADEQRWGEAYEGAIAFSNLMRQVEVESDELAHHWQAIKALANYLKTFNVKTTVMEQQSKGADKKKTVGFKLLVSPSQPLFHQHWAGILAEKLAQAPLPASLTFATRLKEPRIGSDQKSPHALTINLPALTAIDPYVPPFDLERLLYLNQQIQYRKSHDWENAWPRHFLRRRERSISNFDRFCELPSPVREYYRLGIGYSIETVGAIFKKALYLETLLADGLQSEKIEGELQANHLRALHLAIHARKGYELALGLAVQKQLSFEYLGSGSLFDKFRVILSDLEALEIFSPKVSNALSGEGQQTDRLPQVLRELVLGYAWIADYSDLLKQRSKLESWTRRNIECHPLFDD